MKSGCRQALNPPSTAPQRADVRKERQTWLPEESSRSSVMSPRGAPVPPFKNFSLLLYFPPSAPFIKLTFFNLSTMSLSSFYFAFSLKLANRLSVAFIINLSKELLNSVQVFRFSNTQEKSLEV